MHDTSNAPQVLLVEDEMIAAIVAQKILSDLSYPPTLAKSGAKAIQAARSHGYQLIFMDIGLPDMTGIEAATLIHQFDPAVTIVALTAYPPAEIAERCQAAGIVHILQKPAAFEDFKQMIVKYIPKNN